MAVWPITLPVPELPGYGVTPESAVGRTQFEAGPARQRLRFTAVPQRISVSWRLTSAQMAIFRAFVEDDINHGTDWFTCSLDVGSGMASYDTRFIVQDKPYDAKALPGMNWSVSAMLEVRGA